MIAQKAHRPPAADASFLNVKKAVITTDYLTYDVIVVGTGAAGYAAACRVARDGRKNVCVVTEGVRMGTSRNTGSDKQTYYKLNLGAAPADSVGQMAADLFACGCVDGDNAFCEAALSARCFFYLTELGVPFPCGAYGEYVGYKTDHDPRARASSAGPLTSKYMTEALEREAARLGVPVYDHLYVAELLTDENGVCGAAAVDTRTGEPRFFRAPYVVLATGGPAGIYADSVYPACHTGSTSLALRAGAAVQNLTEWQYGLAATAPRWNVSGTYMQALPRLVSVDDNGTEREFLTDYLPDVGDALNALFLKGYQWPFDSARAKEGSSRVDLAVFAESVIKRRKIWLDYTKNPFGMAEPDASLLSEEARDYLSAAGALFGRPIDRLLHMNRPAWELFAGKGVDLRTRRLPVALCAQHCNGGVSVDAHWQTRVPGLFAVGECAGTHGLTRPGGSALNAGQVGALRAAEAIGGGTRAACTEAAFAALAGDAERRRSALLAALTGQNSNVTERTAAARRRFGAVCGPVRVTSAFATLARETEADWRGFETTVSIASPGELADACRLRDTLTVQAAMLAGLQNEWQRFGAARGAAVYTETPPADGPMAIPRTDRGRDEIQQIAAAKDGFSVTWRPARPLPETDPCFENVWRSFRERAEEQN